MSNVIPLTTAEGPPRRSPRTGAGVHSASLADVPAIARLATVVRPREVEPAQVARARRLLLTHVTFEYGALWVEHDEHGTLTRAAAAIPGGSQALSRPVLSGILRLFEEPVVSGSALALGDDVLRAIDAAAPTWILAQITMTGHHHRAEDTALLTTAVTWAAGRAIARTKSK